MCLYFAAETVSLQGNFCLYPLPDDRGAPLPPKIMQSLPPSGPVECIVRVYVIRAFDLQPQDPGGLVRSDLLSMTLSDLYGLYRISTYLDLQNYNILRH